LENGKERTLPSLFAIQLSFNVREKITYHNLVEKLDDKNIKRRGVSSQAY